MGGAVSSGESNDDLIDNLLEADYIKSPLVERVFRAVDRAFYYTEPYKQNAYKDLAWKDGNLHLSAPCIYSEVLENLDLRPGMYFLNVGSGTGYFSTMCGLILGKSGINHGIELYPDVVNYARMKLGEFLKTSPAIDEFDFCPPEFTVGNCLDAISSSKRYDRIYCGAACPEHFVTSLIDMLKIGGICIVPVGDSLIQITRVEDKKDERKTLLPVSFATLVSPKESPARAPVELPEWSPRKLTDLCRSEIRDSLRQTIPMSESKSLTDETRKKKRKRRQERRRASRLVVVQRRRSGEVNHVDGANGFVAIAYAMEGHVSDEERNQNENEGDGQPEAEAINQDDNSGTSSDDSPDSHDALNNVDARHELDDADTIMEEEESETMEEAAGTSQSSSDAATSAPELAESAAGSSGDGGAVVAGTVVAVPSSTTNGKKASSENGNGSRREGRRPERRSVSASVSSSRGRQSGGRPRSARNYTTGAESLLGRIRELVRARQQDLESMRRQFQRSNSESDSGRSRSASARNEDDDTNGEHAGRNGNAHFSDITSSDSSPSMSATSTSDEEVPAENQNQSDRTKKRSLNESGEEEKNSKEPRSGPDPLQITPCSVQMRQKILDLPLPPALKVYLNYDRKLYY